MFTKVILANDDKLKCPACGNKTFAVRQKTKDKDGNIMTLWVVNCEDCGLVLKFTKPVTPKT